MIHFLLDTMPKCWFYHFECQNHTDHLDQILLFWSMGRSFCMNFSCFWINHIMTKGEVYSLFCSEHCSKFTCYLSSSCCRLCNFSSFETFLKIDSNSCASSGLPCCMSKLITYRECTEEGCRLNILC